MTHRSAGVTPRPRSDGWRRVIALLDAGHPDEAEEALLRIRQADPDAVAEADTFARICLARGDPERARQSLVAVLKRHPHVARLHHLLALSLFKLGRLDDALFSANEAERLSKSAATTALIREISTQKLESHIFSSREYTPDAGARDVFSDPTLFDRSKQPHKNEAWSDQECATDKMAGPAVRPTSLRATSVSPASKTRAAMKSQAIEALLSGTLLVDAAHESLFESALHKSTGTRSGRWVFRAAVFGFVASFVLGAGSLLHVGMQKSAADEAERLCDELDELLRIGSYEPAAGLLDRLQSVAANQDVDPRIDDTTLLSNALLYRFFDHSPTRLSAAARALGRADGTTTSLAREVARAIVTETTPYAAFLTRLWGVASQDRDGHGLVMAAIVASKHGQRELATQAFLRAEAIEPTHLAYRFEQFDHHRVANEIFEAKEVADRMTDINPKSPWTRLAHALLAPDRDATELVAIAGDPMLPAAVRQRAEAAIPSLPHD